ncbi:MAG TPA: peptidylprolyl isomerase [Longimicrobiaceae bacterium]
MMQDLREKTKIIMIIVALAFVGLMVFEWGMDISGRSAGMQTGELGRVNGQSISYQAYSAAYQELYNQARAQAGGELTAEQIRQLEDAAFNQVVNDILIQQEMERRQLGVTDEEIRQAALWNPHPQLMQNELFMTDGQFDIQKWQQFLTGPTANEQMLLQLEAYYRSIIPREKLLRQVTAGMYISDAELWQLWKDRNETVTADYVALNVAKLVPGDVEVTDAEIRAYYERNRDSFRRPATARFTIAMLSKIPTAEDTAASLQRAQAVRQEILDGADFAAVAQRESADPGTRDRGGDLGQFTRGQMTEVFDEAAFSLPIGELSEPILSPFGYHLIRVEEREGDTARARHILIPIEPTEAALDRLYARADSLETLAEQVGVQRAARATNAIVRQSVLVSAEQSLVPGIGSTLEAIEWAEEESAAEDGETVSPLFETPQAFYVVEREAFTPAGQMSLQEATPEIRRRLIQEKKRAQAREIGSQIVAEVRGGKTLEAAASERGLEVQSIGPVTRLSPNPAFGQANAAVGAAFGTPVGQVSDVVETPAGLFIVRPTERTEADPEEFQKQKGSLRMLVQLQQGQQEIARFVQSLREEAEIVDNREEVLRRTVAS